MSADVPDINPNEKQIPSVQVEGLNFTNIVRPGPSQMQEFRQTSGWHGQAELDDGFTIVGFIKTEPTADNQAASMGERGAGEQPPERQAASNESLASWQAWRLLWQRDRGENAAREFTASELATLATQIERMTPSERTRLRTGHRPTGYTIEEVVVGNTVQWYIRRNGNRAVLGTLHSNNGGMSWLPGSGSVDG